MNSLGLRGYEALHYYVRDLERSRRFYTERLDFAEIAVSTPELEETGRQRSAAFRAGNCTILVSQPIGRGGRAWRYLQKHPDGVGTIVFAVEDIETTFRLLEERDATPITDVQEFSDEGGTLRTFSITTPFGDTTFRFVERRGFKELLPGMKNHPAPVGGQNRFGFDRFDHVTSNFQTMKPALLWMQHVMGLEEFWRVQFHTEDVAGPADHGSGLRSVVMWDRESGVKFANNEPMRPHFKTSQINLFGEDHRGDGVQHVALSVRELIASVEGLRDRKVEFMETPGAYYDMLADRMERVGVGRIDEDIEVLRNLGILVDGENPGRYLLQIFLKDSAGLYDDPDAGPFFFEIIQRKGDSGFGAGNFRALFESIEREQRKQGRL